MRPTRLLAVLVAAPLVLGCIACSAESRLWRLSPFSGTETKSSERANLWPLTYASGSGTSILWPLMDFDDKGFAVRPLVSHDDADWDVLFPLSHWNTDSGEGWALTAYSYQHDAGLFPLCNFGPDFNYFIPAWWWRENGSVTSGGIFPIAGATRDCGYAGPIWWNNTGARERFGLFPLVTWSDLKWIGPVWWNDSDPDEDVAAGLFPLVWKWGDPARLLALPLYYGDAERRFLFPLYYGDRDCDVAFPFYAHFGHEGDELTAWFPFCASRTSHGESHWYAPIGDGWHKKTSSGRNLYPLWYSAHSNVDESRDPTRDESRDSLFAWSRQLLLPFYMYRERGDDRLLLTPLGGRGWDANGTSRFVNVLGPVFHHSVSGDSETTAIAWPLFERDRTDDTTTTTSFPLFGSTQTPNGSDTWLLAGLGRYVTAGEESSFRLVPFYSQSNAAKAPDLLYDFSLVGFTSHNGPTPQSGGSISSHVFPLYFGSGDTKTQQQDSWLLGGLSRYVANYDESSFRFFPLYSQSNAKESPDPLFDCTLAGFNSRDGSYSGHVFPLYWGEGDGLHTEHTALLGLGRVATTEHGSAWRLWPLASASSDPAADGLIDAISLFRHERSDAGTRDWLLPLYYKSRQERGGGDDLDVELLPPLFHHEATAQGSAWRLWPLVTDTNADGLDGWLDPFTLIACHTHPTKTHVHVGTDALFDFDRYGEGKRNWNARLFTLCEFGHSERTDEAAQPELKEQQIVAANGNHAVPQKPVTVARNHAGFLFDWFVVDQSVTLDQDGARHDESHYRLPLLHEYRGTPEKKEWDLLCYAVHSTETRDAGTFSVLGYGYRSERKGDQVERDIFPFMTWDTAPDASRFRFLARVFDYKRQGDKVGGHVLFIPWGHVD